MLFLMSGIDGSIGYSFFSNVVIGGRSVIFDATGDDTTKLSVDTVAGVDVPVASSVEAGS